MQRMLVLLALGVGVGATAVYAGNRMRAHKKDEPL